ncbi:hypothetical protein [Pseudomonas aeruginosa]|uniref:hypothetical protein n=1 Tax=Pseudomonas aeruginosa TaxID=287 RepID=UPI000F897239|nr:hypothetical protein [Pseudomonas aeruginosa]RSZ54054.1 hypothetical protein EJU38_05450 [Pseudomonas aeruginosa]WOT60883.1 hypothetical protein R5018_25150 [Pseudomonas aeruginosa]WOT74309.1 hypothetical protein R5026_27805 [Pseudomonas aeruginosa]WOT85430.1 hypothetical protein R5020_18765 [Pseudomonas aeruginosa]WOT98384.1 hypothetical protein R5015_18695 [Pseudomonas aeruginosa]
MAQYKTIPLGGQFGGFTPYGNVTTLRYQLATSAAGVLLNSNAAAALAVNDVVAFELPLPAGFVAEDLQVIVSDAFGAGVTADVGFAYADGVDDATFPQDAAYFGSALALSATARLRTTSSKALFALPKDANLVITIKGAAVAEAGKLQVIVHGERLGAV